MTKTENRQQASIESALTVAQRAAAPNQTEVDLAQLAARGSIRGRRRPGVMGWLRARLGWL